MAEEKLYYCHCSSSIKLSIVETANKNLYTRKNKLETVLY